MLGKAHRVVGFFLLMLGAGLMLESGVRRPGLALALVGCAIFARGLWLIRRDAAMHRLDAPVNGGVSGGGS